MNRNLIKCDTIFVCKIIVSRSSAKVGNFSLLCSKWKRRRSSGKALAFIQKECCVQRADVMKILTNASETWTRRQSFLQKKCTGMGHLVSCRQEWLPIDRPSPAQQEKNHALVLDHYLGNSNTSCLGHSRGASHKILRIWCSSRCPLLA